jgi:hypothetical protein
VLWLITRPGPGRPATVLIAPFDVGGAQNTEAAIGVPGLGTPLAVMVGKKHSRLLDNVHEPQLTVPQLLAAQSALFRQLTKPRPFARSTPLQKRSIGPFRHSPSLPPTSVHILSLHWFGLGLV